MSFDMNQRRRDYGYELVKREGRGRKGDDSFTGAPAGATGKKRSVRRIAQSLGVSVQTVRKLAGMDRIEEPVARTVVEGLNGDWEHWVRLGD